MTAFRLAAVGLLVCPGFLVAQKREDILSIQRDVAQLQDQVKQLQSSQDQKMASLQALVQQAVEESSRLGAAVGALQKTVTDRLADQQTKMEAPLANVGARLDQSSEDVRAIRENVAALNNRLSGLDNKLADISSAIRAISAASAPPPPPAANGASAAPAPPPGVSAEGLWQNAFRDYSSGKDELAMSEFTDYLKYFPQQTENAAASQFYIGQLYDRAKQYDDAVQAFDAVLERYPENPKTPDARYMKGVDLMKAGRKTDATTEFKDFLAQYPTHSLATSAQQHLRELGATARPSAAKAKKK
ncbi:MAG TPA: tetratricopeptide repeat protein [Bryobacteraceae bacterium]|nr:tetratricopeptide repeat protein [Bryobacteraceae bacterium]